MSNTTTICRKYIQNLISVNNYYYTNTPNYLDYPYLYAPKYTDLIVYLKNPINHRKLLNYNVQRETIKYTSDEIYNTINKYLDTHTYNKEMLYFKYKKPEYTIRYEIIDI